MANKNYQKGASTDTSYNSYQPAVSADTFCLFSFTSDKISKLLFRVNLLFGVQDSISSYLSQRHNSISSLLVIIPYTSSSVSLSDKFLPSIQSFHLLCISFLKRIPNLPSRRSYHTISWFLFFCIEIPPQNGCYTHCLQFLSSNSLLYPFQSSFRAHQFARISIPDAKFKFQFSMSILCDLPGVFEKVSLVLFLFDILISLVFQDAISLSFLLTSLVIISQYSFPWWFNLFT